MCILLLVTRWAVLNITVFAACSYIGAKIPQSVWQGTMDWMANELDILNKIYQMTDSLPAEDICIDEAFIVHKVINPSLQKTRLQEEQKSKL
jgi:hypothetical protein